MSIPTLIRRVVTLAGSQTKAAVLLGVTQPSISRYVRGLSTPIPSVLNLARRILAEAQETR